MEKPILYHPATAWLKAELAKQIEAYDQSLINEEIFEVRKKIAMRIVEIEKNLVNMQAIETGYVFFRGNQQHAD